MSAPSAAGGERTVRDELAAERTRLANDRTLLAFVRTGIGIAAAGVTAGYVVQEPWAAWAGRILVLLGVVALVLGFVRYSHTTRFVHRLLDE